MSAGLVALLMGLFVVPLLFLTLGHGWRRRSPRLRSAFWGGVLGYAIAACAALIVGIVPPSEWSGADVMRGALGFWSPLVVPALGAGIAVLLRGNGHR